MLIIVVLSATAVLASCRNAGNPSTTAPSQTTTAPSPASTLVYVFGRVVDYKTNAPVANATIAFYNVAYGATAATAVTGASGFYSAELPRGRTYNPRISGFPDDSAGTIMPVGNQYLASYFVNGGDCALFYGTIRDAVSGEPIPGATVAFGTTTHTATDGSYVFDLGCPARTTTGGFPPFGTGTVFMTGSAPGYVDRRMYGNRREFIHGLQRIDVALDAVR